MSIDAAIDDDAVEPGVEIGLLAKTRKPFHHAQERLLGDIQRFLGVVEVAKGNGVDPILVAADEGVACLGVALASQADPCAIRGFVHSSCSSQGPLQFPVSNPSWTCYPSSNRQIASHESHRSSPRLNRGKRASAESH
jgi:hypothetical protein